MTARVPSVEPVSTITQKLMKGVVDYGVSRVVERTIQSIPRAFVAERQDEIALTVRRLTTAYEENRLSSPDIRAMTKKVGEIVADQEVTPAEIDDFIRYVASLL